MARWIRKKQKNTNKKKTAATRYEYEATCVLQCTALQRVTVKQCDSDQHLGPLHNHCLVSGYFSAPASFWNFCDDTSLIYYNMSFICLFCYHQLISSTSKLSLRLLKISILSERHRGLFESEQWLSKILELYLSSTVGFNNMVNVKP